MNISVQISRLLAVFLIAGLVFAPLSASANAGKGIEGAAPMAAAEMAAMATDMPCCPDKSGPVDCGQCPLMALCMVTNFQVSPSAATIEIRPVTVRLLAPGSDPQGDSLGQHPPPRPPRSLVRSA
ncbi:hypothetical protein LJR220_000180 [Bradyrhizobium sp. LjRoot220]|uniref:hypothetical protein n=1 Tax=Bradyrhizobium sp. LjRoot220 TaxID=3342284 RepID=UPI003ECFA143